jgi:hypothetical protein
METYATDETFKAPAGAGLMKKALGYLKTPKGFLFMVIAACCIVLIIVGSMSVYEKSIKIDYPAGADKDKCAPATEELASCYTKKWFGKLKKSGNKNQNTNIFWAIGLTVFLCLVIIILMTIKKFKIESA